MTLVGLEPTISGSVDRCLIHWATGPPMGALCIACFEEKIEMLERALACVDAWVCALRWITLSFRKLRGHHPVPS